MLTFVYPYKSNGGDELLWSIRSIHKYCVEPFRVVVITDKELPWFKDYDVELFVVRDYSSKKQSNQINKLLKYSQSFPDEDFVLMNDDFIFLEEFKEVPVLVWGKLDAAFINKKQSDQYKISLRNAKSFIGLSEPWNFEIHYPLMVNPKGFVESLLLVNWRTHSTCFRSIFGNHYYTEKDFVVVDEDFKVYNQNDFNRLKNGGFISLSEQSANFVCVRELLKSRVLL